MKMTIDRDQLFDGLQKVLTIVGARSTLQILGNVMMEANASGLALTTTDLEMRIRTEVPAKVEQVGCTSLPAKTFFNVIKDLPGKEVTIESNESHQVRLESGSVSYRLNGLGVEDFPKAVEFKSIRRWTMPQMDLSRTLALIVYAASTDDSRKNLNGVYFNLVENTFTAVATDGKRLALVEKVMDNCSGDDGGSIIPAKGAGELQRLLGKTGEVAIELGENQGSFSFGSTQMTTKLVEGTYPNYRQVIPTSFSKKIELPTEQISSALRRVSLVVSETSPFIKLTFGENLLQLHAESSEKGEGKESLPINYTGQELMISFNPNYLSAPFRTIDADRINLQINDSYSPVAISVGEGFLYVIMPMRQK